MWSMLTIMAFGAAADPLIKDNTFGAIWAAYPSDPAKRDALHRCGEIDSDFSRFSARDRDLCYQAMLRPVLTPVSGISPAHPVPPPGLTPRPRADRPLPEP
jgi:hypothetical protein